MAHPVCSFCGGPWDEDHEASVMCFEEMAARVPPRPAWLSLGVEATGGTNLTPAAVIDVSHVGRVGLAAEDAAEMRQWQETHDALQYCANAKIALDLGGDPLDIIEDVAERARAALRLL